MNQTTKMNKDMFDDLNIHINQNDTKENNMINILKEALKRPEYQVTKTHVTANNYEKTCNEKHIKTFDVFIDDKSRVHFKLLDDLKLDTDYIVDIHRNTFTTMFKDEKGHIRHTGTVRLIEWETGTKYCLHLNLPKLIKLIRFLDNTL